MVSLTLSVSDAILKRMRMHSETKWSEVVRSILEQQLDELDEAERIASKSKLSERDAEEIAKSMDSAMYKKWTALARAPGR